MLNPDPGQPRTVSKASCSDMFDSAAKDTAYFYDLPPDLIAQDPPPQHGGSRLLQVRIGGGVSGECAFQGLPELLRAGDLLVLNDSRVLPARLWTRRLDSGGRVELLLVRPMSLREGAWLALARPAKRLRPGVKLEVTDGAGASVAAPNLEIVERGEDGFITVRPEQDDLARIAEQWGEIPLPPYIKRDSADPGQQSRRENDRLRYQTVYAQGDISGAGSVAAPTAGLHFSSDLLDHLAAAEINTARVRLHVGPGTFRPPTPDQIDRRRLHLETFRLPSATWEALTRTRRDGGRIIAVGTTSLRVLETVHQLGLSSRPESEVRFAATSEDPEPIFQGSACQDAGNWEVAGDTRLFIRPPDTVQAVDGLLTNFHLPGSSLLMLVAALAGDRTWRDAYDYAVARRLRFYSYGDAMLVL